MKIERALEVSTGQRFRLVFINENPAGHSLMSDHSDRLNAVMDAMSSMLKAELRHIVHEPRHD